MFGLFKKKPVVPALPNPGNWPYNSSTANEWMDQVVEYTKATRPQDLPALFSPACGDYLPLRVHVGSSWKDEHLRHYRELKAQYPEAVEQARKITEGIAGRISMSRIGDYEDYHGLSLPS